MNPFLNMAIVNAVTVIPLAVLATCLFWRSGRAPLQHTAWVLILLKLVTPPLFSLPMEFAVLPAQSRSVELPSVDPVSHTESRTGSANSKVASKPTVTPSARTIEVPRPVAARSGVFAWHWSTQLLALWGIGSGIWLIIQAIHALRFEALITYRSRCPDDLQSECTELAQRLGIVHVPRVCLIDVSTSPMLWGFGRRAKLLFPAKLAERLPAEGRATLLMHELAHYYRGDHRVRLLELVVTGLFWWHPVVWWARRQIEEAEEECCDAWVVAQFPQSPRRYAEALLDTIDFLCEQRRALPPMASGLGHAPFLRRRLTQIMQGTPLAPLSQRTRWALTFVAISLLPLQPFILSAAVPDRGQVRTPADETQLQSIRPTEEINGNSPARTSDRSPQRASRVPVEPSRPLFSDLPRAAKRTARSRKHGEIWSTAVSPDGRYIVRISTLQRITLSDIVRQVDFDLSSSPFTAIAFSPDSQWFATIGHADGRILIREASTGNMRRVWESTATEWNSVAVAPDGDRLAVGSRTGQVMVLDLQQDEPLASWVASSAVNCVRFAPNGEQIAVACGNWMTTASGQVLIYDTREPRILHRLSTVSTGAISFVSDEEVIVGGWNGRVQLWNLASGNVVAETVIDKNLVAAASFSADNPALREAELSPVTSAPAQDDGLSFLRGFFDSAP